MGKAFCLREGLQICAGGSVCKPQKAEKIGSGKQIGFFPFWRGAETTNDWIISLKFEMYDDILNT
jgi:hypothetical protein